MRTRFRSGVDEQGDLEDEQGDSEDEQGDSDDVEEGATEDPVPSMANRRSMANKKEQLGEGKKIGTDGDEKNGTGGDEKNGTGGDEKNGTGGDEKNGTRNGTRIKTVVNRVSTNIRLRVTYLTCAVDRGTVEVGG